MSSAANVRWLVVLVVALAAVLAAGATSLARNEAVSVRPVEQNALVNYDGSVTAP